MSNSKIQTHRCEGSLNNKVSIRYTTRFSIPFDGDYEAWRLFNLDFNDYNYSPSLSYVCEIKYCPFCSKKLQK